MIFVMTHTRWIAWVEAFNALVKERTAHLLCCFQLWLRLQRCGGCRYCRDLQDAMHA